MSNTNTGFCLRLSGKRRRLLRLMIEAEIVKLEGLGGPAEDLRTLRDMLLVIDRSILVAPSPSG